MSQQPAQSTEESRSADVPESVQSLQNIFTDITDCESFVETHEQRQISDRLVDANDPGEYVSTMVKTDGLSETLGEGNSDQSQE